VLVPVNHTVTDPVGEAVKPAQRVLETVPKVVERGGRFVANGRKRFANTKICERIVVDAVAYLSGVLGSFKKVFGSVKGSNSVTEVLLQVRLCAGKTGHFRTDWPEWTHIYITRPSGIFLPNAGSWFCSAFGKM